MKLETERLILRKPKKEDWREIYKLVDKEIIKNYFMPYPFKEEDAKGLINHEIENFGKSFYNFIVELKENSEIIGMVGIRKINNFNKTANLSSWVGKKYRRKYYVTEAKIAIIDFAFKKLKLRKLVSDVVSFNKESNNMQIKFGMKFEGTIRKIKFNPFTKKYEDMNSYGLFAEEWKKVSSNLKKELKIKKIK